MLICICKGISDSDLAQCLNGQKDYELREACKKLGLGSDCGTCLLQIDDWIHEICSNPQAAHHLRQGCKKKSTL